MKISIDQDEMIQALTAYIAEMTGLTVDEMSCEVIDAGKGEYYFCADVETDEYEDGPDDGERIPTPLKAVNS